MSASLINQTSLVDLGERLRLARDAANLTQKQAADAITIARTTLVAIEQGQRRVRMDELLQLAKLYRASVNALLRSESVHVDLVPRFRRSLINVHRPLPTGMSARLKPGPSSDTVRCSKPSADFARYEMVVAPALSEFDVRTFLAGS